MISSSDGPVRAWTPGRSQPGRGPFIAELKGAVSPDLEGKLRCGRKDAGGDHLVTIVSEQVSDAYLAK